MPSISGTALHECKQLRDEANSLMAIAQKLRHRADAVLTSGAPARYLDALELFEELSADAQANFDKAMGLYRRAHATERYEWKGNIGHGATNHPWRLAEHR